MGVAVASNAACYRYVETRPESVTPGSDVRVRVSFDRAAELRDLLDQEDPREVGGIVMGTQYPESLRLSVPFQGVKVGSARRGFNSVVDISFLDMENIHLRKFDWARTGGLVGVSALVTTVLIDAIFDPFENEEGDDEGGIDAAVITLLKIRW